MFLKIWASRYCRNIVDFTIFQRTYMKCSHSQETKVIKTDNCRNSKTSNTLRFQLTMSDVLTYKKCEIVRRSCYAYKQNVPQEAETNGETNYLFNNVRFSFNC